MKVLVIGQGLAGTLAGFRLERAGHHVNYIDHSAQTAASTVAAGIINPITGRRFVKSWRFDELLPEAIELYQQLGQELNANYWLPQTIIRTLYNRGDLNDWQARSADEAYQSYMCDDPDPGRIPEITEPVFAYAGILRGGRVDVGSLVRDYRQKLIAEGRFIDGQAQPTLNGSDPSLNLGDYNNGLPYDKILFCEGAAGHANPYFPATKQTAGNKGEVLIIKTEAPVLSRLFKHRVFLVPYGENTYWVGATSENDWQTDAPTDQNFQYLKDRLDEILTASYQIIEHRAAIRPTVRDRRMIIGQSPLDPSVYLFNGLGTKGASLGPLGSRWLLQLMEEGAPPPPEVDYARFGR